MKHLAKETPQSSHYTPTKPQKVVPGPFLKGKEGIVEMKPEQFIRLATKAETISQAAKNKAFNSFPKIEGMQVVYKPYGEQGNGFYYVPETGRVGFEPIPPEFQLLAEEAKKYKSAKEFISNLRDKVARPTTQAERKISAIYDKFVRNKPIEQEWRVQLTDFYNQAKGKHISFKRHLD